MAEMRIVVKEAKAFKDGKLDKLELTYSRDGKMETRKIVKKYAEEIYKVLSKAKDGDQFDITSEKDEGSQYWTWTAATPATAETASSSGKVYQTKSTYETPEERAKKQVYIARQNSVTNAVAALGVGKKAEDYLVLAQKFVDFIGVEKKEEEEFKDDLPFDKE